MSANPQLKNRRHSSGPKIHEPVLSVTRYDRLSAGIISLVVALGIGVFGVVSWWLSTRPVQQEFLVPLEIVRLPGGFEDGVEGETLLVESPDDPAEDAAPAETPQVADFSQLPENVVEFSTHPAQQQADAVFSSFDVPTGRPGSAHGTGRRPLGSGGGEGGIPAEQRWFIRYADETSLVEYASQLDFFGIELGALLPTGELIYLSHFTAPQPIRRSTRSGKGEQRLYMTWQGGSRKAADVKLFSNAGVPVDRATFLHFYPPDIEQQLLTKEFLYHRRTAQEIRRTYFLVTKSGNGFDFTVTRQTYLK